tara:strand:+ start:948 stop:2228 length:1281 start_codon:yes stop_codon:yes gene_type:complete
MNLKRYRVNNIKEALKFIKRDLGPDALIISTRQVKEGKGALGMFSKNILEVTAAGGVKQKNEKKSKALRAYEDSSDIHEDILNETFLKPKKNKALPFSDQNTSFIKPLQKELRGIQLTLGDLSTQSNVFGDQIVGEIKQELDEMRNILHVLASRTEKINEPDLPENLLLIYQQMKFSGLEEKFAKRLVIEAQRNIDKNDIENYAYVKIFVARMLMKIIKTNKGLEGLNSSQKIMALLGPTGVGKTTTIAKIASEQSIQFKRKVALISVTTNLSSSSDKIRSLSKMINVPFSLVKNKNDLNRHIKNYEDFDTILIDTEGCSQRNDSKLFEIRDIFDEQELIHNSLVLSATSKDSDLNEVTRKFGCMNIDSIIFTKLDESASYGSLFNHTIRFKKPLSYLTLGQKIPEDLETASRERLVDLLLNISGT